MPTYYYGTPGDDDYNYYFGTQPLLAYGYGGADTLLGGAGNDTLYGGAGNDELNGMSGDDLLYGGSGNDYLNGSLGNDLLYGGAGNDGLDGDAGNDTLRGGAGADFFDVGYFYDSTGSYVVDISSVDTIADFSRNQGDKIRVLGSLSDYSLDQTQNISGKKALDTAIYYQNNLIGVAGDTTQVSLLEDFIFSQWGTYGDDVLTGEAGADLLHGGWGNDTLDGGAGNDSLYGDFPSTPSVDYSGKDVLYGGAGNDSLYGGLGEDTLTGGAGADIFDLSIWTDRTNFASLMSVDTITDFRRNQGDKIKVFGSLSDYSLDQTQNISGGSALDTAIYYNNTLFAIIQDTTQVSLSSDFIFV